MKCLGWPRLFYQTANLNCENLSLIPPYQFQLDLKADQEVSILKKKNNVPDFCQFTITGQWLTNLISLTNNQINLVTTFFHRTKRIRITQIHSRSNFSCCGWTHSGCRGCTSSWWSSWSSWCAGLTDSVIQKY